MDGKQTSDEAAPALPPGFAFLSFGPGRYVLVNDNSGAHRSQWISIGLMCQAAWDWWYDVRQSHG